MLSYKSIAYPVAGALVGAMFGGPLAGMAGAKLGSVAALGGSIVGKSFQSITVYKLLKYKTYAALFHAPHDNLTTKKISKSESHVAFFADFFKKYS